MLPVRRPIQPGLFVSIPFNRRTASPIPYPSLANLDAGRISRLEAPIGKKRLICLKLPPCAISASDIRSRVRQGLPVANLLPPLVESYILQHYLYQEERDRTNS
jgi:nicotinate-nucleotide adenylyltransferase